MSTTTKSAFIVLLMATLAMSQAVIEPTHIYLFDSDVYSFNPEKYFPAPSVLEEEEYTSSIKQVSIRKSDKNHLLETKEGEDGVNPTGVSLIYQSKDQEYIAYATEAFEPEGQQAFLKIAQVNTDPSFIGSQFTTELGSFDDIMNIQFSQKFESIFMTSMPKARDAISTYQVQLEDSSLKKTVKTFDMTEDDWV